MQSLIAVLIVHIVDNVEGVDVKSCQPLHHIHVLFPYVIEVEVLSVNRSEFRTYLESETLVHTAVYSVEQALCKVCSCTEELHFLANDH